MKIITQTNDNVIEETLKVQGDDSKRLGVLWSLFSSLDGDDEFEEIKRRVKNGVYISFNIEKIIKGYIEEYPSNNLVKIKGHRKFSLEEYWDEVRKREKIMRNILEEEIEGVLREQGEWDDK